MVIDYDWVDDCSKINVSSVSKVDGKIFGTWEYCISMHSPPNGKIWKGILPFCFCLNPYDFYMGRVFFDHALRNISFKNQTYKLQLYVSLSMELAYFKLCHVTFSCNHVIVSIQSQISQYLRWVMTILNPTKKFHNNQVNNLHKSLIFLNV